VIEPLPKAVSVEALYLAAVLAELRALRVALERPKPAVKLPSDVIELREPKRKR